MKTVLIIAPQFSPSSYPPAHRVRLFTNYLEKFGWKPIVVTVEPDYLEEIPDWDFHQLIPDHLEIIRTRALSARWTRKIGIGDLGIRSFWHIWQAVKKTCEEKKVDLLLIPGPPWYTFLIGPLIKNKFRLPYVLDYIDPWVSSQGQGSWPWKKVYWYRKIAMGLEPFAVKRADGIVSVSDGTNEGIKRRYPFINDEKFIGLPYGYEQNDFCFLESIVPSDPFFKTTDGFFNFVYIGAMLPRAYDTLEALFTAVKQMKESSPDLYGRVRLYFIGTSYAQRPKNDLVMPVAQKIGIQDVVKEHSKRIPYLQAIRILTQANALLALGTTETHYTASKIYPYILANRPLLAIYHEVSSVVNVLRAGQVGEIVTYSASQPVETKVSQIRAALTKIMSVAYKRSEINLENLRQYSAENLTKRLASFLEGVSNLNAGKTARQVS